MTLAPLPNVTGQATISVTVEDDGGTDNVGVNAITRTFNVTVTPVNDAPSFVKGANQQVLEDAGPQSVANWASSISAGPGDESGQALSFLVSHDNPGLFAVPPTISPNYDFRIESVESQCFVEERALASPGATLLEAEDLRGFRP